MSNTTPLDRFQYKDFTPLPADVDPTYNQVALLQKQANANARAIFSKQGSGLHGLLEITIGQEKYRELTGVNFTPPTKPAGSPRLWPWFNSSATVMLAKAKLDSERAEWNDYNNTVLAIRALLLKAVPRPLITELADDDYDFVDVKPIEILTLLWKNHGKITQPMLALNLEKINHSWKTDEPIATLWTQVDECIKFATKGNEPIAEPIIIRSILKNLEDSGVFELDIRDWEKKPEADKTLPNLKDLFRKANEDRMRKVTSASAGYAGTASAAAKPATATPNSSAIPKAKEHAPNTPVTLCYCWSHGLQDNHSGKLCTKKADGHKEAATAENMMGGCCIIQRRRGEKRVFIPPRFDRKKQKEGT